jgi:hypothetical protein
MWRHRITLDDEQEQQIDKRKVCDGQNMDKNQTAALVGVAAAV